MTKVFFVEDEMMIRRAIIDSINWDKYGIQIMGDAPNGEEALKVLATIKVDIIITDIRMPVMDGLELARIIRRKYPHMKIVILSGYNDFEYARSAMQLGVTDYLLKPVSEDELIPLIRRLTSEIHEEQENEQEALYSKRLVNENRILIQSKFIQDILQGNYQENKDILTKAKKVGIDLRGPLFGVLLVTADSYNHKFDSEVGESRELQRFAIYNVFEELFCAKINSMVTYGDENELIVIFSVRHFGKGQLYEFLQRIVEIIRNLLEVHVSVSVSARAGKISYLSDIYGEAIDTKKQHFYDKDRQIQFHEEEGEQSNIWQESRGRYERQFLEAMSQKNVKAQIASWEECEKLFREKRIEVLHIKEYCIHLCNELVEFLTKLGGSASEVKYGGIEKHTYVSYIQNENFLADLSIFMKEIIQSAAKEVERIENTKYSHMIRMAMHYMEMNYCKDISLTELAELTGVSTNYFSRIFKKEVGINFVDWLNKLRVEKAKTILLKNKAKVYEVATLVGYSEYKYFITMFKKYTGITPKQFREKGIKK